MKPSTVSAAMRGEAGVNPFPARKKNNLFSVKKIGAVMAATCLLLVANTTKAQVNVGFKGGISFANLSNSDGDTRVIGHGGMFIQAPIGRNWYIQPELLYAGRGERYLVLPNGTVTLALDYVQIPLMFQYYPARRFYLEFGPQLGILTSARIKYNNGDKLGVTSDYNSTDFAINLGMGFNINRTVGFYGRYNLGLTDISKYDRISYQNRAVELGITLKVK